MGELFLSLIYAMLWLGAALDWISGLVGVLP